MLLSVLDAYFVPNVFVYFYRLKSVSSLQFKLSDKYKVLKNLPINVSSTIMEMMLGLNSNNLLEPNNIKKPSNHRSSKAQIIKFFVKKVKPSIYYANLPEATARRYFDLIQQPLFFNIIAQFYTQAVLNEDLLEILKRITIMEFPKQLSGLFLKTHHISLKMFMNGTKIHLDGTYFLILQHELAHYLQRAGCRTVSECNHPFSPQLNNNDPLTEEGYLLEKTVLFYFHPTKDSPKTRKIKLIKLCICLKVLISD